MHAAQAQIVESFWSDLHWLTFTVEAYDHWVAQTGDTVQYVALRRPGIILPNASLLINVTAPPFAQQWMRDHLLLGHGSTPWSYPYRRGCLLPARFASDQAPLWNEWWGDVGAAWCYWQRTRQTVPHWTDLIPLFTPTHPVAQTAGVWLSADSQYNPVLS